MPLTSDALAARYARVPGAPPRTLNDVPGWLTRTDKMLFAWLLGRQNRVETPGDLLEMGVYQGKTAIHIAAFRRAGERVTVCDLFDFARAEESIRPGARKAYATLTQDTFERNYLAFHDELPTIVRGMTDTIAEHVEPASCRFAHIDASHMYEHVHGDAMTARTLLREDGVIVFDDYRTEHCPGTAAAVWEAVATSGLQVICVSANKFYGTWGDAKRVQDDLIEHIASLGDHRCDVQQVMGQRLLRIARVTPEGAPKAVGGRDAAALLAQSREVLKTAQTILSVPNAAPAHRFPVPRQGWRRVAVSVLPPIVTDTIRRRRARARAAD